MAIDVNDLSSRFTWPDYLVFVLMLAVSAGIGIFFGFCEKKQTTHDFLMAGKSMTTFPVAMSLIASFMSAIVMLGTPSEIYQFGSLYWLIGISYFIVMPSAAYLYFPVFHSLQVTSAYEYLERRFHLSVRMLGSLIFIIQMSLYMAVVVYAPALGLAQVTGLNVHLSVCLICFVCIFYTVIGGMKAVLWTDTLQVGIMYGSMIFVVVKGAIDVGGFQFVWDKNLESGRVELISFDPNPATRHTFWTLVVGGYFTWITIYGVNQSQVQRYLCVREPKMAVNALWINLVGLFSLMLVCSFGGMVIYARYWDCDPVLAGHVDKYDQLLPLLVMDIMGHLPGLPGLFVAGIFSGALSTVSSGINSLAAITLEDFVKAVCFKNMSENASMWSSKGLSLFYGILTFALAFVAAQMGNILSAALSIFGMVGGPLLGVFTLGMFFPWANSKGAFVGTISGLVFMFWIGVGNTIAKQNGHFIIPVKPLSTEGCWNSSFVVSESPINKTTTSLEDPGEEPLGLYKLSYMWYSCTGCYTVIVVGMIVSAFTGFTNIRLLDPRLMSPGLHLVKRWIPGLEHLSVDYRDEDERLKEKRSCSSFGETNFSYGEKHTDGFPTENENSKL